MGEEAHWGDALSNAGYSLLAAVIWSGILLAVARAFNEGRRAYFFGLGAASGAYVVAVAISLLLSGWSPTTPGWVFFVALPPLVEEAARLVGADSVHRRSTWRQWMVFGVAYALFEAGLKLGDAFVYVGRSEGNEAWAGVLVPVVPFLLHVFLSLLMCVLLRRGVSLLLTYLISAGLHAAHNWSAWAHLPTTTPALLEMIVLRSLVFILLIGGIIGFARCSEVRAAEAAGS
jgi:hypothetical protein